MPHSVAQLYTQQQNKRRYNLHFKVKKEGFEVDAKQRTILIPSHKDYSFSKLIPKLISEFNYQIQLFIPTN